MENEKTLDGMTSAITNLCAIADVQGAVILALLLSSPNREAVREQWRQIVAASAAQEGMSRAFGKLVQPEALRAARQRAIETWEAAFQPPQ